MCVRTSVERPAVQAVFSAESCRLLRLVALVLLCLSPVLAVDSTADRSALESIYQSMGGLQWTTQTDWMSATVSMCSWFGVACQDGCPTTSVSIECRVVELNLASNGLQNAIAIEVEQLVSLTKIVLGGNSLSGVVPSLSALVNLKWLDLNTASLSGTIPEFQTLASLERLELYGNQLDGTLPSFDSSVSLSYLDVGQCYGLAGPLPLFSSHLSMKILYMNDNQFSGTMPSYEHLV
jgi:hypothetical protein